MTDRIRVVAGLAVNKANLVLVAKRPEYKRGPDGALIKGADGEPVKVKRPGMWEYPGGKVERAEGDEHALIREWQEELRVKVTVKHRIARVPVTLESPTVLSLYHVVLGDQTPTLVEHTDLQWVDPLYAIQYLASTPTTYDLFPHVKAFLRNLSPDAPR